MIFKSQTYAEMMEVHKFFSEKTIEEQIILRMAWASEKLSEILNISLLEAEISIKIFHPMLISDDKEIFLPAAKTLCNWLNSKDVENYNNWFLYSCFKYCFLEKWINCQNYQTMTTLAAEMLVYSKDKDENEQY